MSRVQIGKAKFGSTQKKFWKLKDGESVYGILPPIGDLAQKNKWSVYYKVHYGYKNAEGKNRAFTSSLTKNKQGMVIVPDAALERIEMLKAQLEAAKKSGNEKAKEALLKLISGPKALYNLDNNFYVNAIDLEGNIGILKLRYRAFQALELEIKKLHKKGIDPIGEENRRFFVFSRSGMGLDTSFKVDVYKKTVHVDGLGEVQQEVVHSLTDDIRDRLGDEAGKLDQLFKSPTSEQIAQIVKESVLSTGISENIDDILGFKSNGFSPRAQAVEETEEVVEDVADEAPVVEAPAPKVVAQAPAPAPVEKKATPAPAKATPKSENKTEAVTAPSSLTTMSDAEFLASLGITQ